MSKRVPTQAAYGKVSDADSERLRRDHVDHLQEWFERRADYTPGELIKRLPELAFKQYLTEQLLERWPDQLIAKYGLETVKICLADLTETHGHGLKDGIDNGAGFLRWTLNQGLPRAAKYLNGHRERFSKADEEDRERERRAQERGLF